MIDGGVKDPRPTAHDGRERRIHAHGMSRPITTRVQLNRACAVLVDVLHKVILQCRMTADRVISLRRIKMNCCWQTRTQKCDYCSPRAETGSSDTARRTAGSRTPKRIRFHPRQHRQEIDLLARARATPPTLQERCIHRRTRAIRRGLRAKSSRVRLARPARRKMGHLKQSHRIGSGEARRYPQCRRC